MLLGHCAVRWRRLRNIRRRIAELIGRARQAASHNGDSGTARTRVRKYIHNGLPAPL